MLVIALLLALLAALLVPAGFYGANLALARGRGGEPMMGRSSARRRVD